VQKRNLTVTPVGEHIVRFRQVIIVASVVLLAGLAVALTSCPITDVARIDSVSGSIMADRYLLFLRTHHVFVQSAIEQRATREEGGYVHDWRFLNETGRTIWDRWCSCGVGLTPPVYELRAGELNERFARSATDQEFHEFLHAMRAGNADQQKEALQKAVRIAIEKARPDAGIGFQPTDQRISAQSRAPEL